MFLSVKKRVTAQFSQVVLDDHPSSADFADHIGQKRHFAPAARQIDYEMGHRRP
jgi:hypothetical protein